MELDKHAEQEFPVGERVVVTHSLPTHICRRGEVLEVFSSAFIWWCGGRAPNGFVMRDASDLNGWKVQCLKRLTETDFVAHPVAWLRKLEDPDALTVDKEETVEA